MQIPEVQSLYLFPNPSKRKTVRMVNPSVWTLFSKGTCLHHIPVSVTNLFQTWSLYKLLWWWICSSLILSNNFYIHINRLSANKFSSNLSLLLALPVFIWYLFPLAVHFLVFRITFIVTIKIRFFLFWNSSVSPFVSKEKLYFPSVWAVKMQFQQIHVDKDQVTVI